MRPISNEPKKRISGRLYRVDVDGHYFKHLSHFLLFFPEFAFKRFNHFPNSFNRLETYSSGKDFEERLTKQLMQAM